MPRGGPAGGDGGKGGDVLLTADPEMNNLKVFSHRRVYKAEAGGDGGPNNKHGSDAANINIRVPAGTEVWEVEDGAERLIGELTTDGQSMTVAKGGRGGWGNARFTSSTNQAPTLAETGEFGESRSLRLNLKVLADVGLIGMPNAGKSSILAAISAANPKIASYPFTTLEPMLGVTYRGQDRFVVVDIPGLIEGAHEGAGLGVEFLKHIERARVLIHVIDGSEADLVANMRLIDIELAEFNPELTKRPQVIAVNKLDLPETADRRRATGNVLRKAGGARKVMFVSAATHDGLKELIDEVWRLIVEARQKQAESAPPAEEVPVLRPRPVDDRQNVVAEGDGVFRIIHPIAMRLAQGSRLDEWSVRVQYHARLGHMKVLDELRRKGIKPGDRVLVADKEYNWE